MNAEKKIKPNNRMPKITPNTNKNGNIKNKRRRY